jgi:hypothetical protein
MATSLAGNFLVEGEPFDVTKINKMLVAVQELQEKTSSLENTLKLPDGSIKQYIPVVWGYRTKPLTLKGTGISGPFQIDWANSPLIASEQTSDKLSIVATLAEGGGEDGDYRISFTDSGVPQMYVKYVPAKGTASVKKSFNIIAFYPREKLS